MADGTDSSYFKVADLTDVGDLPFKGESSVKIDTKITDCLRDGNVIINGRSEEVNTIAVDVSEQ